MYCLAETTVFIPTYCILFYIGTVLKCYLRIMKWATENYVSIVLISVGYFSTFILQSLNNEIYEQALLLCYLSVNNDSKVHI